MITIQEQHDYLEDAFDYLNGYAMFFAKLPFDLPDETIVEMFDHALEKTREKLGRPYWDLNPLEDNREANYLIGTVLTHLTDWYKGDWHLTSAGEPTLMGALGGSEE